MADRIAAEWLPEDGIAGIPESKISPLLVCRVTVLGSSQRPQLKMLLADSDALRQLWPYVRGTDKCGWHTKTM
jgi:hypothetical protein